MPTMKLGMRGLSCRFDGQKLFFSNIKEKKTFWSQETIEAQLADLRVVAMSVKSSNVLIIPRDNIIDYRQ